MKKSLKQMTSVQAVGRVLSPAMAIIASIGFVSCSKSNNPKPETLSSASIQSQVNQARADLASGRTAQGNAALKDAASKYARMGELLLMPEGFQYADEMFGKALDADPSNAKANFYKAITEPAMLSKGFLPKVERLLTSDEDAQAVERFRHDVAKLGMPEVSQFVNVLPPGEKPFVTYHDVQRYAREKLLTSIQTALSRLEKIDVSTAPLQLNINPDRLKLDPVRKQGSYSYQYSSSYCQLIDNNWSCQNQNDSSNYSYEDPKPRTVYFFDKHDMKIIVSSYKAMVDGIRVATAYSMKDSEFAIRRLKAMSKIRDYDDGNELTAQDVIGVLREFPDLWTLESDQQLSVAGKDTAEAFKNGLELANLREQLCDGKSRDAQNAMIYPICLTADEVNSLQVGVDLLAGPKEISIGNDPDGEAVKVVLDLTAVLKNPPKDIKALLPVTFDAKGRPVKYPDPTMGGLFPNGDIIEKFKQLAGDSNDRIDSGVSQVNELSRHLYDRVR